MNADAIMGYLMAKGLSRQEAASVAAIAHHESSPASVAMPAPTRRLIEAHNVRFFMDGEEVTPTDINRTDDLGSFTANLKSFTRSIEFAFTKSIEDLKAWDGRPARGDMKPPSAGQRQRARARRKSANRARAITKRR